jgi:hypothetical protein
VTGPYGGGQVVDEPFVAWPDFDLDCDVDTDDLALFEACASGPGVQLNPGCENRDSDHDGDIDQSDFAILQRCYSGEGNPADPNCGN